MVEEERNKIVWETPENPPKRDDYIFHHGKRMVRPYYFEFIAHVKKRWAGKKVVDLFSHEFRQRPYEYYVEAVKSGRICVDGKLVSDEYVVKASQTLSHFVHRHEPPVMAEPIMILDETSDVITVCKPSSIPVHPCGQYRKNTVIGILEAEHGIAPLFPIHRLDRLVSGLLILAKNAASANQFRQEIEAGKVQKEYVAKVKGVFPAEEVEVDANVFYDAREGKSTTEVVDGSNKQPGKGKAAHTKFVRLGTNGIFSIVKCLPVSGRTHQIRVHLQHLGHPIANDALYSVENPPDRSIEGTSSDRAARRRQTLVSELGQSELCSSGLSKQCNSREEAGIVFDEDLNEGNPSTDSKSRGNAVDDLAGTIKRQKVEGKSIMNKRPANCSMGDPSIDFQKGDANADERLSMHGCEKMYLKIDSMCTNCPNVAPSGLSKQCSHLSTSEQPSMTPI
ncbi:RNA pseudouridine synthase 7 isoform X2 [Cryptomeria japonica]|uniref:RNA pseudouridine synthase 7 isoform X2 n=1 Tax=Cryptomeria japonica TaxID=3369 RepID=UPI0025AC3C5D|nr:RNA pseudouridine synthase 7 isoform X2 [Cryptomeria japonica]